MIENVSGSKTVTFSKHKYTLKPQSYLILS